MKTHDSSVLLNPSVSGDLKAATPSELVTKQAPSAADIQTWIVDYLAKLLEVDSSEVDVTIPFDRYGLDSSAAVGLTGDLEDWLGCEMDPTLLYDYPTIESLVQYLSEGMQA